MTEEVKKQKLTLNVDNDIIKKAKDQNVNISQLTEKMLRLETATSKTENNEKRYKAYQELFDKMLPLLRKFKVQTEVGVIIIDHDPSEDPEWTPEFGPDNEVLNDDPIPSEWYNIFLLPDGKLMHDACGEIKIRDEPVGAYHRPLDIIDNLLEAIQENADYHKDQFKEIEMAKTIIDAITKVKGKTQWK